MFAVIAEQPGAVAGAGIGPSTRSLTVTVCATSGAKPTAPFHVKPGANGPGAPVHGIAPLAAPSVVAGSPRINIPVQAVGVGQEGRPLRPPIQTAGRRKT